MCRSLITPACYTKKVLLSLVNKIKRRTNLRHRSEKHGAAYDIALRYHALLRQLKIQLPTLLCLLVVEIITFTRDYGSNIFSLVAPVLLLAVVYVALHSGVRQGLISATIILLYNTYSLFGTIEAFSFADRSIRRIVLLMVVLPFMAVVIGRLKERNNRLLADEKESRLQAEASERRFRFMAESMPQKIFTVRPNGESEYSNPQWQEYTGLTYEQMKNDGWEAIIHPDDLNRNKECWKHSLSTGQPFQFEHRLKRADGEYRWHLTRAEAMQDDAGKVTLWIGSSTDTDDIRQTRKLKADTLRLTKQRAQLVALNTAKDEFISLASHQLRTPATGVKQYVGMVLEGYAGEISPQTRKYLERAYEGNERQLSIIGDLLQVAQVDAGKVILHKEQLDLTKLISNIVHEQSSKFKKHQQTVKFHQEKEPLSITADPHRLRMVLENIIDNACKYTPAGRNIDINITRSKGKVRIHIQDQGVGIAKEHISKVFEKFQRLDNPLSAVVGGTGLGLYWAHKIIHLHKGDITVDSEVDKGTTFTITLPLS